MAIWKGKGESSGIMVRDEKDLIGLIVCGRNKDDVDDECILKVMQL